MAGAELAVLCPNAGSALEKDSLARSDGDSEPPEEGDGEVQEEGGRDGDPQQESSSEMLLLLRLARRAPVFGRATGWQSRV